MAPRARAHPATCACCRPDARRALRRPLHYAERVIDVEHLTSALDAAKARLHALIVAEQRNAARRVSLEEPRPRVVVTPAMLELLAQLFEIGRQAAIAEAALLGVTLEGGPAPHPASSSTLTDRAYASRPHIAGAMPDGTERPATTLAGYLAKFSDRLRFEALSTIGTREAGVPRNREVSAQLDARAIMARAIVQTPGALDAAGRVVSMTLDGGLADVFQANADAFEGWLYTAVLDGATCPECEAADGTEYPDWESAMVDMPDGGPNPNCDGEFRCRCRLVPIPFGGDQTPLLTGGDEPVPPAPEPDAPPAPDGSFSSSAYDAAADAGAAGGAQGSIDSAGVLGGASGYRVLEHAKADHEIVVQTGREVRDEINRRAAALETLDVRAAEPELAITGGDGKRVVLAPAHGEVRYVSEDAYRQLEREVLAERGVEFGTGADFEARYPTAIKHANPRKPKYGPAAKVAQLTLRKAASWYPKSWLGASNRNDFPSLKVVKHVASPRSHYSPGSGILALSTRAQTDLDTAIHEMAHRMEASIPALVRAERAFYEWRARGGSFELSAEREAPQVLYTAAQTGETDEYAIFDEWLTKYMGKEYAGETAQSRREALKTHGFVYHGSYEIFSQTMGEVFGSRGSRIALEGDRVLAGTRSDRDLMDWLYGVLVHVRPEA